MPSSKFQNLFKPFQVNKVTYKNRIVSAPMTFSLSALDPQVAEKSYRKVESRAKGGAAAVIVGETDINFTDADRLPFPNVDFTVCEGKSFDAFAEYANRIHKYGAVAICELAHAGSEKIPFKGQKNPIGPVAFTTRSGIRVEAMTQADMDRVANEFAIAAQFMQKAGFDGILIHGGHGFLFTQFLSPRLNTRTDTYGGTLENRAKFPLAILKKIRETTGKDFIIDVRLSAAEGVPGGGTVEETGKFCNMIEGIADSVHISTGLYTDPVVTHQFSSMFVEHGCNAADSAIIKQYTNLPVGVVGGINSPEMAEKIIAEGKADYVILGRQMIADPEFANKAASGRENEIRRCVRCFNCFPGSPEEGYTDIPYDGVTLAKKVGVCAINPETDTEVMFGEFGKPEKSRRVLIIGGGPAGMQAAITACNRGHKVTLVDEHTVLGGVLNFTDIDVDKKDLRAFKNLLTAEVQKRNIEVIYGKKANGALIKQQRPEVLILAIGATPSMPPIKGLDTAAQALEIFDQKEIKEKRIIMIGGGLVGCEAGLHLAKSGHKVTIIEMLEKVAKDSFGMYREALMHEMDKCEILTLTGHHCMEITSNSVRCADELGNEKTLKADRIFYALGMKSNKTDELKSAAGNIPVFEIGDCIHPGKVDAALKTAYLAAMNIM